MDSEWDIEFQDWKAFTTGESTVTLSHGETPSTFSIEVLGGATPKTGAHDLKLTLNGRPVITFKRCAISSISKSDTTSLTYRVTIKDRRWEWQNGGGYIVGHYNRKSGDGKVVQNTYKSPRELVKLLLDKLGEKNADLSGIPTNLPKDQAPECQWDYIRPAEALGKLCNDLGVRIVLRTDDRIAICRSGEGKSLPEDNQLDGSSETLERTDIPSELELICDRSMWQGYLLLEPVGEDLDGKIKHIDELSYKPAKGWKDGSADNPETAVTHGRDDKEKARAVALAKQCVWRWYRVKSQPGGGLTPAGFSGEVKDIQQLIPLPGTALFDSAEDENGNVSYLDPFIEGVWYDADVRGANTPVDARFPETPSIDTANGIVKFSRPMYAINAKTSTYEYPHLWLFCTYWIKDKKDQMPVRYTKTKRITRGGTSGTMPFHVEEIGRQVTLKFDKTPNGPKAAGMTDNKTDLDKAADYYLSAKIAEIAPAKGQDYGWPGFVKIEPDGAIQQVTWELSGGVAKTRASRNSEHSSYVPKYEMRRRSAQGGGQQAQQSTAPRSTRRAQ